LGQKKLVRKAESPSKRGMTWPRWTGFRGMTVRDWLDLLVVPLALVVISFLFTTQQDQRQQEIESQRAKQAQKIENQRAEAEQKLAEQRAQDEALQAYLNQMGGLLLEKDLRESEEGSEVRTLARARTLTVLGRLDPSRKRAVMQFLIEAELVQSVEGGSGPIITLAGADLSEANLSEATLRYVGLFGADLSNANLSYDNLSHADLTQADLSNATLRYVGLSEANLSNADLRYANLSKADLSDATLSDADGVTEEQLEEQAQTLAGATMPDGTIYPGRYAAREFEPAVSFEVGEGWEFVETRGGVWALITTGPKGGQLLFTNPSHVFDPSNPSERKKVPAPQNADEWVSWFQRHPNLNTSKPVPVSVGGASGMQIDVTASSTLENYSRDICGKKPCIPLYPTSGGPPISAYPPEADAGKDRYIIVDVRGETVVINVTAPAGKFDTFSPKARKVLNSVEWKGG
jgi:uncharacterized protein YjbI with pentapeptide repeats